MRRCIASSQQTRRAPRAALACAQIEFGFGFGFYLHSLRGRAEGLQELQDENEEHLETIESLNRAATEAENTEHSLTAQVKEVQALLAKKGEEERAIKEDYEVQIEDLEKLCAAPAPRVRTGALSDDTTRCAAARPQRAAARRGAGGARRPGSGLGPG